MPPVATEAVSDFDRHFRRAVWIAALITAIGAAIIYADKATEDRSAFIRWRPQVLQFMDGINIYETKIFPNPPIFPITLYPLAVLPKVEGAITWFVLKVALTAISIWLCFRMVRPPGTKSLPSWVQGPVILLSLRPIMSDLHHANNNLIILFLVVTMLYAWRKGYDVLSGLLLALAISYKVTPALFVPYFLYKRSWRTVGATCLGMGVFLLIIPSLVIGPTFNGICLATWWQKMLSPFISKGFVSPQEINQSLVGVLTRLMTDTKTGDGRYDVHLDNLNFVSWPPATVKWIVKGVSVGMVAMLAVLCRTKARRRDDPRLLGEFALVVLTMLFVSERSWKHHFVTMLLPYTYLVYRAASPKVSGRERLAIGASLVLSALLMATTSSELGGLFTRGHGKAMVAGHKIALGYGMFLWAGMVVYFPTAWRVWVERNDSAADTDQERPVTLGQSLPAPHRVGRTNPIISS